MSFAFRQDGFAPRRSSQFMKRITFEKLSTATGAWVP